MNDKDLLERVDNWARWTFSGGTSRGVCASAERHYTPEKLTDAIAAEKANAAMPIDHGDGERVDAAVASLLPHYLRCMVAWHINRRQFTGNQGMCKMFKMSISSVECLHRMAVEELGRTLKFMDSVDAKAKGRYKIREITEQRSTRTRLPSAA